MIAARSLFIVYVLYREFTDNITMEQKKRGKTFRLFLISSGSGIRTARPSGYEPDELPTALSRDIGLQIYGQFLKLQILFTENAENLHFCVNLLHFSVLYRCNYSSIINIGSQAGSWTGV